jgi:hypothetical protein
MEVLSNVKLVAQSCRSVVSAHGHVMPRRGTDMLRRGRPDSGQGDVHVIVAPSGTPREDRAIQSHTKSKHSHILILLNGD